MESMNRLEESRQTNWSQSGNSTVRERRWWWWWWGARMNEWVKPYWSSWVQSLFPAVSPSRGLLHCLVAQALLGSNPVFCPNYQLRFTEEGQRGEKISLSNRPPLLRLNPWPGVKLTERRGCPRIAPALGAFQLPLPPLQFTHSQPQDFNPLPLSMCFHQVTFKFTAEAVTCSNCLDRKYLQNVAELKLYLTYMQQAVFYHALPYESSSFHKRKKKKCFFRF